MKFYFLCVLFFLIGCKTQTKEKQRNYKIVSGKWYDTSYYENGKIKSIEEYKDTVLNGSCIEYYPSGAVHKKYYAENGQLNGDNYEYYPNGQLQEKFISLDGRTIMSKYKYYETGELNEYWFYDYRGRGIYNRIYKKDGEVISTDGVILGEYYIFSDTNKFNVNDTLSFRIFYATPPDCKVKIVFGELENKIRPVDLSDLFSKDEINSVFYKYKFNKGGVYNTYVEAQLSFNNKIISTRKKSFKIKVRDR